jgi:hypothetical protein
MPIEDAAARHTGATPDLMSKKVCNLPETDQELAKSATSRTRRSRIGSRAGKLSTARKGQ